MECKTAISLYEECARKIFKTDTPSPEQVKDAKRAVYGMLFGMTPSRLVSPPVDEETREAVMGIITARSKERLAAKPQTITPIFSGVRTGRWVNKEIYPCKVGVSSFINSLKHYKDREDKDASS